MLIAFCSFKHAPGASTTALGLARCWPRPVLLGDLDPAGGDLTTILTASEPLAAGLQDGLLTLRRANSPGEAAEDVWQRAVPLTGEGRLRLLPGLDDASQTSGLRDGWQALADALTILSRQDEPVDVLADCGRLSADSPAWPVLCTADIVVPVVMSTPAGVRRAAHGLRLLTDQLVSEGSSAQLRLLVREAGPYRAQEIADALVVPLLAGLPDDPAGAALLAAGSPRRVSRTRLWRQLAATAGTLILAGTRAPDAVQGAEDREAAARRPDQITDGSSDAVDRQRVVVA